MIFCVNFKKIIIIILKKQLLFNFIKIIIIREVNLISLFNNFKKAILLILTFRIIDRIYSQNLNYQF